MKLDVVAALFCGFVYNVNVKQYKTMHPVKVFLLLVFPIKKKT